jgi:hypothetical protein
VAAAPRSERPEPAASEPPARPREEREEREPLAAREPRRDERPPRYEDREGRRDRGRRGERERRGERRPRPERPQRGGGAGPTGEKEFWEVWSEESGRTAPKEPPGDGAPPDAAPPAEAPAEPRAPRPELPPGHVRLYLNLGRKDRATAEEIAGMLAAEGVEVPPGDIELMNTHSYVNVGAEAADRLCKAFTDRERDGRKLVCEAARPPRRR